MDEFPFDFPAGLGVLAVDHDNTVLENIKEMCTRCQYHVVTCSNAQHALDLLRENLFDVILTEHMPTNFGIEFFQFVSKEFNIPVIVMSSDAATSAVMKAITHGACDYWIKPLREEQIMNIWQHVARKVWREKKGHAIFGCVENGGKKRRIDDSEFGSTVIDAKEGGVLREQKKRILKEAGFEKSKNINSKEANVDESENYYASSTKKPRVTWSRELHQKFVVAVIQIGLDKATPKKIHEVMNVPSLTKENIASHLQRFRLDLKRSDEGARQQNGMPLSNTILGPVEFSQGTFGRSGFESFDVAGHVPYDTLAGLYANNMVPNEDQTAQFQQAIQWPNHSHSEQDVAYAHPLPNCPPIFANIYSQPIFTVDQSQSSYGACPPTNTYY